MELKLLHTADWHLDSPFSGFSEEQRAHLRAAQERIPDLLGELARREGCALALLSGDIFDGEPSQETLRRLAQALESWKIPVFISPGNHDFCKADSPWNRNLWPENVHIFTGGPENVYLPELDLRVYGAGYQAMDCPPLLAGFSASGEMRRIMTLHGDPTRADSPYCPVTEAQIRESGLMYLALGHVHKSGTIASGGTLCAWPGCPMGRGWDETGEKGALLVTLTDHADVRFVPLPLPTFWEHTLRLAPGTDPAEAAEGVLPAAGDENFYRLTFTGQGMPDIPALERRLARFSNLILRNRAVPTADLWERAGEDSLEGLFFESLRRSEDPALAELAAKLSRELMDGQEVALP